MCVDENNVRTSVDVSELENVKIGGGMAISRNVSYQSMSWALCICSVMLVAPAHALAQAADSTATRTVQQPPTTAAAAGSFADIVVTGTRTRSTLAAPTPTQAFTLENMEARGQSNVTQMLLEVPAFSGRSSNVTTGQRGERAGTNYADLRALGSMRTLVLVNGRRFVPVVPLNVAGYAYQVDLNQIPTLMIERVDVVTGGASAQYGSDAIAGVVNLVLRERFDGVKVEAQTGISQLGDGHQYRFGLLGGFSFAEGRGHVVLSADYDRSQGLGGPSSRKWSNPRWAIFTDPTATASNGLARNVLDNDVQAGNRAPGGLIVNTTGLSAAARSALIGLQFDSPTTVSPFERGKYNPALTPTTFSGTQSGGGHSRLDNISLLPSVERKVVWGHASYELSDNITAFVDASWAHTKGRIEGFVLSDQSSIYDPVTQTGTQVRIFSDNAFIPAVLRPFIPAPAGPATATQPAESFTMSRHNYDFGDRNSGTDTKGYTFTAGLKGELGGGWTWDASYIYGSNDYERLVLNQRDRQRYALAADAVRNPANDQIVCRSTLTNPTNGCVPVNLFGSGTPSEAALDYFTFTATGVSRYRQNAAQANLQGSPFATWAGDVAIAAGVEWRHESVDATVDEVQQSGNPDELWGLAYDGRFTVVEGYLEATAPLATDLSWAKSLAVNGAVRHARYGKDASAAGGQTTWKLGATYEPVNGLLFRAGHSLDIRAPSLYELRVPNLNNVQNIGFRGATASGVLVGSGGNPNLTPEKAKTTTLGFTLRPAALRGFGFSVDYFNISIKDVIRSVGGQNVALFCERGITSYCDLLRFNSGGVMLSIQNQLLNLASLKTNGVDFTANYNGSLGEDQFSVRATATYTRHYTTTIPTPSGVPTVEEVAGGVNTNAQPRWKGNLIATYTHGPLTVSPNVRYVGKGLVSPLLSDKPTATAPIGMSSSDNSVGDYYVFGLSASVNILPDEGFQVFGVVDNLFNRDPEIVTNAFGVPATNGGLYDFIGRYFRVGVRAKF